MRYYSGCGELSLVDAYQNYDPSVGGGSILEKLHTERAESTAVLTDSYNITLSNDQNDAHANKVRVGCIRPDASPEVSLVTVHHLVENPSSTY